MPEGSATGWGDAGSWSCRDCDADVASSSCLGVGILSSDAADDADSAEAASAAGLAPAGEDIIPDLGGASEDGPELAAVGGCCDCCWKAGIAAVACCCNCKICCSAFCTDCWED